MGATTNLGKFAHKGSACINNQKEVISMMHSLSLIYYGLSFFFFELSTNVLLICLKLFFQETFAIKRHFVEFTRYYFEKNEAICL